MNFEYYEPTSLKDVFHKLEQDPNSSVVIAGGTDVIPKIKSNEINPKHLISINKISKLHDIDYDDEKGLYFGAAVTLRTLEENEIIKKKYPALYESIHSMASTQIRNTATVVGNICNAIPSADTAPALIALDAIIKIGDEKSERSVNAPDFFTGVGETVLAPNEIVTGIQLPKPNNKSRSTYIKFTVRRALELAIVGVAVNCELEDDICKDVRIALGAVSPVPKRALNAEECLRGKAITEEIIKDAALIASEKDCSPISDVRASKNYRRNLVRICTKNALINLCGLEGGAE